MHRCIIGTIHYAHYRRTLLFLDHGLPLRRPHVHFAFHLSRRLPRFPADRADRTLHKANQLPCLAPQPIL